MNERKCIPLITHSELTVRYRYSAFTGLFLNSNEKPVGQIGVDGYVKIGINGKTYSAHRLAWFYVYGLWPIGVIDHINGWKFDNRFFNLMETTPRRNARPRRTNSEALYRDRIDFPGMNLVDVMEMHLRQNVSGWAEKIS